MKIKKDSVERFAVRLAQTLDNPLKMLRLGKGRLGSV